ncbi:hypothetical protein V496_03750 [Pseudogymnoascus sp. VKM F-4515 (FW-2607)]|nr:hypothetical protein V496_03750 [Pseudogymnoascus sp. VKM F-4515 (FW-2607)]KFY99023.1 hypothetical protein V498_01063 [Pseudogymnoascus sp. VKM F-4517 (FW-2822)]
MGDGLRQRRFWTTEEDRILRREATLQLEQGSLNNWTIIAAKLPSRTNKDCRKRWSKVCSNVNRGAWDSSEDERLVSAVKKHSCSWTQVATLVECAKRWQHSLDPTLDHSKWQPEHEAQLRQAVAVYGRNWKIISEKEFLGRSTTDLKNRYDILERKRIAMERSSSSAPSSSSPAAALIACRDTPILGDEYDNIGEHSSPSEHGQEHDDNDDSMLREPSRGHKRLRANRSPARLSSRTSSISQTSNENRPTNNYNGHPKTNGAGAANLPWKNHNCDNNSKSLSPYTQMNNNPDSSGGAKMVLDPEMFPEPSNDSSAHSYLSDSNLFSAPTTQSHQMSHSLSIPDQNSYQSVPYYSNSCLNDDALSYDEACFLFSELDPTVLGQGLLYPIDDSNSVGSSGTTQSHRTADSMMFENDIMAPIGRRKLDSPHAIDDQLNNDVVMEMRCGDPREECGREDGVLGSRTTLILEDVQPDTLRMVLDTLYKDKTKMSMEMWHN